MLRKHKHYARPRKPFDRKRIDEENVLREKYGLKNKKEIWKADAKLHVIRRRAKDLITSSEEAKGQFLNKLNALGLKVKTLSDVLALTKEDILERRLQTILFKQKIASTPKSARQMIAHKHVEVQGKIVDIPSFWVPIASEGSLSVKEQKKTNAKSVSSGDKL
jgi:small subunit ribosomal protein S4